MNYSKKEIEKKLKELNLKTVKRQNRIRHYLRNILFFFVVFACVIGVAFGIGAAGGILDSTPPIETLHFGPTGFATKTYDRNGNLVETLVKSGANREAASFEEIPKDLINAFVAIEDERFWEHSGIDIKSITRAIKGVLTKDSSAGGGSTLTQQLIKNNVFSGGLNEGKFERYVRKLQEQYLALKLENQPGKTKQEIKESILTDYLNTINLGANTLGVKVAAKRYFDKELKELTLSECAVIASITKNPTANNPITHPENNDARRRVVLKNMYDQGYIEEAEMEQALADNVYERIKDVDLSTKAHPYSYFTDALIEQVLRSLQEELGCTAAEAENLLYSGGLSIYTTQDMEKQAIVDEEINRAENYDTAKYSVEWRYSLQHADQSQSHYSEKDLNEYVKKERGISSFEGLFLSLDSMQGYINDFKNKITAETDTVLGESLLPTLQPQASFVLMDQSTGEVLALSGGRGEKLSSLTLNRATQSTRQPGSTFKVISTFAPAIDQCGATLATPYYDGEYTVGEKSFRNWYSSGYLGYQSIRDGIVYSLNIVAARCMMETVTPKLGIEYARTLGISTLTESDYNVATALGGLTQGVTNLELTNAFATIANHGVYNTPKLFTKIVDHDGNVLIDRTEEVSKQVMKESTAFLLTDAMAESMQTNRAYSGSISVNSTSTRARLSNMTVAGKSGTTTANNDIWFVGYTPYYTAGIWGGCDNNQKLKDGTSYNGGTSFHKDIWRKIMERVHQGKADIGFSVPDDIVEVQICRKSGKLAVDGVCTNDPRGSAVMTEYFAAGTEPTETCDKHTAVKICTISGKLAAEGCPYTTAVRIVIPEKESRNTDDGRYAAPMEICSKTHGGTVQEPETEEEKKKGSMHPLSRLPQVENN